ncbi:MAG: hypothetical protein KDC75_20805, partial [Phaeodactylibacter sp.]|nr:hypothetical protein [Phaeodactylibacter sp.]
GYACAFRLAGHKNKIAKISPLITEGGIIGLKVPKTGSDNFICHLVFYGACAEQRNNHMGNSKGLPCIFKEITS